MEITNRIKDKVTDCLFFELKERKVSQAEFARIIALRHGIKFDKSVLSQIGKSSVSCPLKPSDSAPLC